jgi:hypothetical protein
MTDAPEKIWANRYTEAPKMTTPAEYWEKSQNAVEYTRADIANARVAELEAALKWVIMDAKKSNDLPLLYRAQAALKGNPTTEEAP